VGRLGMIGMKISFFVEEFGNVPLISRSPEIIHSLCKILDGKNAILSL
jgi:hypothetical protein